MKKYGVAGFKQYIEDVKYRLTRNINTNIKRNLLAIISELEKATPDLSQEKELSRSRNDVSLSQDVARDNWRIGKRKSSKILTGAYPKYHKGRYLQFGSTKPSDRERFNLDSFDFRKDTHLVIYNPIPAMENMNEGLAQGGWMGNVWVITNNTNSFKREYIGGKRPRVFRTSKPTFYGQQIHWVEATISHAMSRLSNLKNGLRIVKK